MMTSPIEHVRILSETIGSRMAGSPGNHAAANYIATAFDRAGLVVERQGQPCPAWRETGAWMTAAGRRVKAYANTFSPPCDARGIIFPVGTLADLAAAEAAGELRGKIVVLYGELAQGPLSPKRFFFAAERDLKTAALLEDGAPAAVATVNPLLGARFRLIEDPDFTIPSVTVPLGFGLDLVRAAGAEARVRIQVERGEGMTENIIARSPGADPHGRRIVLCAHYDTKPDTPGAIDNASGVAVLLRLAERLRPRADGAALEFVAFTNEEFYVSPEQDVYFQASGASFGEIVAAINLDGIGGAVSATNLATFSASPAFEAAVEEARAGFPGVYRADPWPASNHYLFFSNGVPAVALSSGGPNFGPLIHTPNDTFHWVGEEKLLEAAGLVERMVEALADKMPAWGRV